MHETMLLRQVGDSRVDQAIAASRSFYRNLANVQHEQDPIAESSGSATFTTTTTTISTSTVLTITDDAE